MTLLLLLLFCATSATATEWKDRYPYGILTPDYGILSEADLHSELRRLDISSPTSERARKLYYTRWACFPSDQIRLKTRSWRYYESEAAGYRSYCDLEFQGALDGRAHIYGDRRGHPIAFCREIARKWREYRKGEKYVCMGGGPAIGEDPRGPLPREWVWEKFKTRKGCVSYFGDC